MNNEREIWEKGKGVRFLKKIGVRKGHRVLDFGAGVGKYSIPAALIVGNDGVVFAIDNEQEALNELKQKTLRLGLKNLKIIRSSGKIGFAIEEESMDASLLYDVLHYLRKDKRKLLYKEIHHILKQNALLSVYPKHVLDDMPMGELKELTLNDVKQEIQNSGFSFTGKLCDEISHNSVLNQGCVLNFKNFINNKI